MCLEANILKTPKRNNMKTSIKIIGLFLLIGFQSCNNTQSLQEYIVEKQQSNDFIAIDIPTSIIALKEENASEETIKALESIKKFNFIGLELNDKNIELYNKEKEQVKLILSNKDFKEIFRLKSGKNEVLVKYLGDAENIDEVVFFGSDNEKGLALVRVLGENMNPAEMVQLMNKINVNKDSGQLKSLQSIFENIK